MKKIVLVDGNSIMFRAYYATAYSNSDFMKTKSGLHTNALFAFINMFEKIITRDTEDALVAFDTDEKTKRHLDYKDYKAGRKEMPLELAEQIEPIYEYIRLKGVKLCFKGGYEADDIIGTIAVASSKKGYKVQVYSSDKDLLQLVDDNVTVNLLKSGMKEVVSFDKEKIYETYGLKNTQMIDLKAIMGDPSDNIKGIPGIGEKGAVKLLQEYGSLDGIYENIDEVGGKLKEKLILGKESGYFSKSLVTLDTDAILDIACDDLKIIDVEEKELISFFHKYELNQFIKNYSRKAVIKKETEFEEINDYYRLKSILKSGLSVFLETDNPNYHKADLWGFGLSDGEYNYFIEPDFALSSIDFILFISDSSVKKNTFDYKALIVALKWRKISVSGVDFDLLLGAYLSNSRLGREDFKTIASSFSYYDVSSDDDIYGRGAKKNKGDNYKKHIASKALAIHRLRPVITEDLTSKNQLSLLNDIEIPLSEVLSEMEYTGIKIDQDELEKQGLSLKADIKKSEEEIYEIAGENFNISSPKQLGAILFEKLNLPYGKKTKTGYSTNIDVLEKLKSAHPIINKIIDYRQLAKLYSTYIEGVKQALFADSKVHTIFMQALTTTGRLSSIEPNLQNIPIRTDLGKEIRKYFVPSNSDSMLIGADYSQIELRVLADIADVKELIKSFNKNEDIHNKTASQVFNKSDITADERRKAKAVNFGIVYGISAFSLSEDIGVTRKEAQNFINKYFEVFPEIKKYMDETIDFARKNGYVLMMSGRRRYIPEIHSANFNERSFGERTAINARIQGTAADIIKIAMIELHKYIAKNKLSSKMLIQVHDELILEVPDNELELLKLKTKEIMEHAYRLKVKLETSFDVGKSWYEL